MTSVNPILDKEIPIFKSTNKNHTKKVKTLNDKLFTVAFNKFIPVEYQINNTAQENIMTLYSSEKIFTNKKNKYNSTYKIGERILILNKEFKGELGTIILIDNDTLPYAVELDEYHEHAHNCDGYTEFGYGYWFCENDLKLVKYEID